MTAWLLEVIEALFRDILTFSGDFTQTLSGFSETLYDYTSNIQSNVFLPIAYTMLGIFFLLEMWNAATKTEGQGNGAMMSVETILKILLRVVVFTAIVDVAPQLFEGLFNLFNGITEQIQEKIGTANSDVLDGFSGFGEMQTTLNEMGFFECIGPFFLCTITLLVVCIAYISSKVVFMLRFIEIFIYICVSPVPLATLASGEIGQVGKNFLKGFIAICLQGTLLFLVFSFAPPLMGDLLSDGSSSGEVSLSLLSVMTASVVLLIAIFSTGRWAKSICNAM